MTSRSVSQSRISYWLYAAAGFSVIAGLIHISVTPEHIEEWIGFGVFFIVVWTCQLLFALILILVRPVRGEILWAGILGNLAIIALWVVTRTVGIPLGPMAGEIEQVGALDVISKIAELGVILCLVGVLRLQADMGRSTASPST